MLKLMTSDWEGLIVVILSPLGGEKVFSIGCCGPIYCGACGEMIGGDCKVCEVEAIFSLGVSCWSE